MVVAEAAGTLWQGNLQRFSWRKLTLDDVHWKITFSGFMPALEIAFKTRKALKVMESFAAGSSRSFINGGFLFRPATYSASYVLLCQSGRKETCS